MKCFPLEDGDGDITVRKRDEGWKPGGRRGQKRLKTARGMIYKLDRRQASRSLSVRSRANFL